MDKFKKTRATYPITGSMRQDLSEDVLPPDNYSLVENFVYRKEGEVSSRNGFLKIIDTEQPYDTPRLFTYGNQLLLSADKKFNRIDFRESEPVFKNNFTNLKNDFFFISQKERDIFFPSILKVGEILHYGYVFKDQVFVKQFDMVQEVISDVETGLDKQTNISALSLMSYESNVYIVYSSGDNIYVNQVGNKEFQRVTLTVADLKEFTILNGNQIHYIDNSGVQNYVSFLGSVFSAATTSDNVFPADDTLTVDGNRAFGFRKWSSFTYKGEFYDIGWARYTGMIVVNSNGDVVSKINSAQTPIQDRPDIKTSTPFITFRDSVYVPVFFSGQAEFEGGNVTRPIGVGLLKITEAESDVQSTTLNNHMIFAGSSLNLYDGENFVEYGFTRRPEASLTSITVPERTAPREVPDVQEGDYSTNATMDAFQSVYHTTSFTIVAGKGSSGVGYTKGAEGSISSGSADLNLANHEIESIIFNPTIDAIEVKANRLTVLGAFQINGIDYKVDDRTTVNNKSIARHYTVQPTFVSGQTYSFQMLPTKVSQTSVPLGTIDVAKNIIGNKIIFEQVSDYTETQVGTESTEEVETTSLETNAGSTDDVNRWFEQSSEQIAEWRDTPVGRVEYLSHDANGINFGSSTVNQINIRFGEDGDQVITDPITTNGILQNFRGDSGVGTGSVNSFIWKQAAYYYSDEFYDEEGEYSLTFRAYNLDYTRNEAKDFRVKLIDHLAGASARDLNRVEAINTQVHGNFLYVLALADHSSSSDIEDFPILYKIDLTTESIVLTKKIGRNYDLLEEHGGMGADENYVYIMQGFSEDSRLAAGTQTFRVSDFTLEPSLTFSNNGEFYADNEPDEDYPLLPYTTNPDDAHELQSAYAHNEKAILVRRYFRDHPDTYDVVLFDLKTKAVTTIIARSTSRYEVIGGTGNRVYLRDESGNFIIRTIQDAPPQLTFSDIDGDLSTLVGESLRVNINEDLQVAFEIEAGDLNTAKTEAIVNLTQTSNADLIALSPQSSWSAFIEFFFEGVTAETTKEIKFEAFETGDALYVSDPTFNFNEIVGSSITFTNDGGSHSFVLTSGDLSDNNSINKTFDAGTLNAALITTTTGSAIVSYGKQVITYETVVSNIPRLSYFTLDVGKIGLIKDDLQNYVSLTRRSDATITQAIPLSEFKSITSGRHLYSTPSTGLITYPFLEDTELLKFVYPGGTTSTTTIAIEFQNRTYGYRYLYKWIDAKGFEYRSAPSDPVIVKSEEDISETNAATLSLSTINITKKEGVVIELYRTKKDSNLYRHVTDIDNLKTTEKLEYIDGKADDDLGAPIEPFLNQIQPDGGRLIERFADRFCVAGFSVEKNKLVYSQPVSLSGNFGVSFKEDDFLILDSPIFAIRRMDANLIIFTEDAIYSWTIGEEPTYISGSKNNSVVDANSVVETSAGIVFKSKKGIYLLTRGRELQYIGIAVQDYNHIRVLRSLEMKAQNEIRFILDSYDGSEDDLENGDRMLVYNFHYNKWSVLKGGDFRDGIVYKDDLYLIDKQGILFREEEDFNGSSVDSVFETGWISFADHSEFKKLKAFRLTAEFEELELLGCTIFYDFNENANEVLDLSASKFRDTNIRDIEIPSREFGIDELSDIRLLRFLPRRQKCESFKLKFTLRAKKAKITALGFEYLTTRTLSRIPPIAQV